MKAWFEAWVAGLLALVMSGIVGAGEEEKGRERSIDTGLITPDFLGGVGHWIDNEHIILNARQENEGFFAKNRISVMYDLTKKKNTVIRMSPVHCVNYGLGFVGFWENGRVLLTKKEGNSFIDYAVASARMGCRVGGEASDDLLIKPLTNSDGYIEFGVAGQGEYDGPAFLVDADGKRSALDIDAKYIGSVRYLALFDKYLLDDSDGRIRRQGHRDFYLMSPTGDISAIPYPVNFVDKVLKGEQFNFLLPVKSGLLIYKGSKSYVSGLYLLKDGQHKKIWGGRGHYMKGVILSPDGCRIAFASYYDGLFGMNINKGAIKILDVCR